MSKPTTILGPWLRISMPGVAATFALGLLVTLMLAEPAHAASPGLQLNPLKYEDTLRTSNAHTGYIDVANPADSTVHVVGSVQGFKQADLDGNLEFFADDTIQQGIKLGLTDFELGPRESIRVSFTVDPTKLPKGGVYAVAFFRTIPPEQTAANTSYVAESANVGTLLLLQNGAEGEHIGRITGLSLPFWQFGSGLKGEIQYQNTNRTTAPIAFSPNLELRVFPWSKPAKFSGPYVLPSSTRRHNIDRTGSYLGLLPVSVTDSASGQRVTNWVFACTGVYSYAVLVIVLIAALLLTYRALRRRPILPKSLQRRLPKLVRRFAHRLLGRKTPRTKQPLDGLSRRPEPTIAAADPSPEPPLVTPPILPEAEPSAKPGPPVINLNHLPEIDRTISSLVILSADGKLLLGRKDPGHGGVYPDAWHIPGGGVEPGEDLETAAKREAREEISLDLSSHKLTQLPFVGQGGAPKTQKSGEQVWVNMTFYRFEVRLAQPAANIKVKPGDDLVEVRWFDRHELATIQLIPGGREFFIEAGYLPPA